MVGYSGEDHYLPLVEYGGTSLTWEIITASAATGKALSSESRRSRIRRRHDCVLLFSATRSAERPEPAVVSGAPQPGPDTSGAG